MVFPVRLGSAPIHFADPAVLIFDEYLLSSLLRVVDPTRYGKRLADSLCLRGVSRETLQRFAGLPLNLDI